MANRTVQVNIKRPLKRAVGNSAGDLKFDQKGSPIIRAELQMHAKVEFVVDIDRCDIRVERFEASHQPAPAADERMERPVHGRLELDVSQDIQRNRADLVLSPSFDLAPGLSL